MENAEKVVNPPKNPIVIIIFNASFEVLNNEKYLTTSPRTVQPNILIINVVNGNSN